MNPRDDDAIFEFQEETPRAVPPPAQNEIDAIVDAISAGGRPHVASESEAAVEADEPPVGAFATVPRELLRRARVRLLHPAAFRFVGAAIVAFALGTLVAWAVLRSFDAAPPAVAINEPAAELAPASPAMTSRPATTPGPMPARRPAASALSPPATQAVPRPTLTTAGRSLPVTPPRATSAPRAVASAPPAVTPRQDRAAAVVPASRGDAITSRPRTANAPRTAAPAPGTAVALSTPPRPTIDAAIAAPPPLASAAVTAPAAAPALVSPPPVVAPAASATPSVVAISRDRDAVLETLWEYRQAYEALDVTATAAIWPSVDRRALARAFSTLKSQELEFRDCEVALADAIATTRCRGVVEYVRKIGNPTPQTGHQEFVFRMSKRGDDWLIDDVSAVARQ